MFNAVGMGYNLYTDSIANPYMTMPNCNTAIAANIGYNYGYQAGMTQRIQSLLQTVAGAISQLTQALQNPNLTQNQKNTIKVEIQKLQKLAKQLQVGLVSLPTIQQMNEIEKGVTIAIQNAIQKVQEAVQSSASPEADDSDDTTTSSKSSDDETEVSEKAAKEAEAKMKKQKTAALEIINDLYAATEGHSQWWNPDNDIDYPKLRTAAKKINKDNVADIVVYWEEQIGSTKGKSLVKALFDGEHGWNPSLHNKESVSTDKLQKNADLNNMDILWNIAVCMKQKAKELGIYNDLAGQFTIAFDELDDACVDQEAVENAIKEIASAIFTKKTEKLAEDAQKAVDKKTKADNKKDATSRKAEVEAQKKQEFQNAFRKAYDLGKNLPELIAGFKVITDDNGEFKEYEVTVPGYTPFKGASFKDIIAQMEEYDIDPKKALVKKVDKKA